MQFETHHVEKWVFLVFVRKEKSFNRLSVLQRRKCTYRCVNNNIISIDVTIIAMYVKYCPARHDDLFSSLFVQMTLATENLLKLCWLFVLLPLLSSYEQRHDVQYLLLFALGLPRHLPPYPPPLFPWFSALQLDTDLCVLNWPFCCQKHVLSVVVRKRWQLCCCSVVLTFWRH